MLITEGKQLAFISKFSSGLNYTWRISSFLIIDPQKQQSQLLSSKVVGAVFNQTKKRTVIFSRHIGMFLSFFTDLFLFPKNVKIGEPQAHRSSGYLQTAQPLNTMPYILNNYV